MKTLEQLFDRMRHDLEKPRGTVKMFLEIADEIASKPDQLELWKKNLIQSFEVAYRKLDETEKELKERFTTHEA